MAIPSILQETELYKRLEQLAKEPEILIQEKTERQKAITLVNDICKEASELMKVTPTHFQEYTLHDETHLLSVTYLMGLILSASESFENLSYLEITILILAAYLHDVGMAPSREKVDEIIESSDFALYREIRKRDLENLREIEVLLEQKELSESDRIKLSRKKAEIEQSILTEYLRQSHGEIGAEFIIIEWSSDKRWEIENYNLAESVSWVCKGHTLKHSQLIHEYSDKYPHEKHIGENRVNILYCTLILRLADILDFDRKRTPIVLYENISPQDDISIVEWNKHKSVIGWEISNETIIFACECTNPVYEKALREYIDYIDKELVKCSQIVKDFPARNDIAAKYKLQLPFLVDRTKIKAKNNAYTYIDLSFSLSHEEIIKLLMGNDFWGGTSLCIRELIQNAYDAIRHRKALEKAKGNDWNQGKITLVQRFNSDGRLELECRDNGIGMDRNILENYFFKIGRSYYRSPEFENERNGLRGQNADFDPISQFGIGIVSCFLIGNSFSVRTQRYIGPNKGCGEQLVINVNGLSRMAHVRVIEGDPSPGTSITIIGKKMNHAEASDEFRDPVFLLNATRYYAAALDIPIDVIVESPFRQCNFTVSPPARPLKLKTNVEINSKIPSEHYIVLQRDFSSMMKDCEGTVKVMFLIDANGRICTKNDLAYWKLDEGHRYKIYSLSGEKLDDVSSIRSILSQDGILIGSEDDIRSKLHFHSIKYRAPCHDFPCSYFINLYKDSKLPLKPSRAPYYPFISYFEPEGDRIWQKFEDKLEDFIGGIIEDVLENDIICPEPENFWNIVEVYNFSLELISKTCAYNLLPIPYRKKYSDELQWKSMKDITAGGTQYIFLLSDSTQNSEFEEAVSVPISGFNLELCKDSTLKDHISSLIRAVTLTTVKNGKVLYKIDLDTPKFEKLGESSSRDYEFVYSRSIPLSYQVYSNELNNYVSVNNLAIGMNFNHPVTQFLIKYFNEPIDEYKWFVYGMCIIAKYIVNDADFDKENPGEWEAETKRLVNVAISHWEKVDWNKIPESIRPPYNIFYPESGKSHPISLEYLKEKMKISDYKEKEDLNFLQSLD